MMKKNCIILMCWMLIACSPVKTTVTNQYKLDSFNTKRLATKKTNLSILVSQPEALAGYQTEQMHYIQKPFELSTFANNAWVSPPASMLYPLIIQSLKHTGYFSAVASGPYADKADYRLDTQLIALQQNFLFKPSVVEFVTNVTLTRVADTHVMASRIINLRTPCPSNSPYGGVLAANQATKTFTATMSQFVVTEIQASRHE